jgi:hypothetical protein
MSYIIIKSIKQRSILEYKIYKDNDGFDNKSIAWESNSPMTSKSIYLY